MPSFGNIAAATTPRRGRREWVVQEWGIGGAPTRYKVLAETVFTTKSAAEKLVRGLRKHHPGRKFELVSRARSI